MGVAGDDPLTLARLWEEMTEVEKTFRQAWESAPPLKSVSWDNFLVIKRMVVDLILADRARVEAERDAAQHEAQRRSQHGADCLAAFDALSNRHARLKTQLATVERALEQLHDISWHVATEINVQPGAPDEAIVNAHFRDWRTALDQARAALALATQEAPRE